MNLKSKILIKEKLKKNQKFLALWAADCAEHVLPFFEKEYPEDDRNDRFDIDSVKDA